MTSLFSDTPWSLARVSWGLKPPCSQRAMRPAGWGWTVGQRRAEDGVKEADLQNTGGSLKFNPNAGIYEHMLLVCQLKIDICRQE